ncbi:MAG: hypothetical protein QOE20_3152 [Mycobacterium sp.]|jgi:hypothetical protein|nr:hypothetical protein [Mycobacterium sp.]
MTTTTALTNPCPGIAPPAGATTDDSWQHHHPRPCRVSFGADRTVTDRRLMVSTNVVQWADGTIDLDGTIEAPALYVFKLGEDNPLDSDQPRELAAALLGVAAETDGWATR